MGNLGSVCFMQFLNKTSYRDSLAAQMNCNPPLSSLHLLPTYPRSCIHNDFIPLPCRSIGIELLVDLHNNQVILDAATDGSLSKISVLIGKCRSIVFIECIACQAVFCHVASKGKWIGRVLVSILHQRSGGDNAVAADKQGPML